jgi:hypothetical protein
LIRAIRVKAVAVAAAVSDSIREIRGKAVAAAVAVSDPIRKIRDKAVAVVVVSDPIRAISAVGDASLPD